MPPMYQTNGKIDFEVIFQPLLFGLVKLFCWMGQLLLGGVQQVPGGGARTPASREHVLGGGGAQTPASRQHVLGGGPRPPVGCDET